ncbi:MAG: sulfide/dihydroorotate dehydrogenase-like FAD/NAD-binding protein [Candidatus Altiarchaeota archaeon]|nr:sulfide/dihydroorotate dehydrogenase-like FAD/NAD-binding protein [Candidatus Altiarchaeota archaeon]
MYKIIRKEDLSPVVKLLEVSAPLIADKAQPGQFVILRLDEEGERIPLTIADFDREKGTITVIFLEVGKTTTQLGKMVEGDKILNLIGPLGNPSEMEDFGTVVCIGGGVGVAPLYPIARALKESGNTVISIIGARCKDLLILEDEMREVSDELYITTDDGSVGHHGFVSDILKRLIEEGRIIDRVIAIGPLIMMKVVVGVTKPYDIKTIVSLNPIMVDGTGMCGSCRVIVGGEVRFACVDGPEFDGHLVDFDNLMKRNTRFLEEEAKSVEEYKRRCR